MLSDTQLREQLNFVLESTKFDFLGTRYEGKVRDSYIKGDTRYLITTDRLSCFDVVVTSIPFKGQTLAQMAVQWFKMAEGIIPNHLIDVPDPNVMVAKNCNILPIEVIVRGYLAGSAWRDYTAGNPVSGITLPTGLKESQKLPEPLLTPSTKAERGQHDMPISEKEIIAQKIVEPKLWQQVREAALALFKLGSETVQKHGLILVDTKYEFGTLNGKLILADEVHTMDSSRYWMKDSYQDRFSRGESPVMLDKEPTRQWLIKQGFQGNGTIPHFTPEHRVEIARHYINAFEKITGTPFQGNTGAVGARIEQVLREYQTR